jgi:TolA-binding protein
VRNVTRLLALALIAIPALSPAAQKKDDLASIQRDIAAREEDVRALRKGQDEKLQALTDLVSKSAGANASLSSTLTALQATLTASIAALTDQQAKQHADVNAKLDTVAGNVTAISQTLDPLTKRLSEIDSKLNDLLGLVKTLNVPPPAPAPLPPTATNGAPAGWSAVAAYRDAKADYNGGRFQMALDEFSEYLKYAPHDDENAPNAQYYIGQIYNLNKQYDDAAKAFGDVDKFPANPRTCDARYMRGIALVGGEHKAEAKTAFTDYLSMCPGDANRESANEQLRKLAPPRAGGKSASKGKAK